MYQLQQKFPVRVISAALPLVCVLSACGGGGGGSSDAAAENVAPAPIETPEPVVITAEDQRLRDLIDEHGLTGDPTSNRDLPSIESSLAQLGKKLFFSKSLGGGFDSACVTCHHPVLGGGDGLSLPVGTLAVEPDLLGPGRRHVNGAPSVPRNSPTVFNVGLWDTGLFWDSRVESIGKQAGANGSLSGIRTPDSIFLEADPDAGANLVAAQARFPVTSADEMKTEQFEAESDNYQIRAHLAARIGDYGVGRGELDDNFWLSEFQIAYGSTADAEELVTFARIAESLGEYERSMVFIDSPWKAYVEGDTTALTEQQKLGAILFLTDNDPPGNGGNPEDGAGCVRCHSGDTFSDGLHHTIGFPQIGPGKGDGVTGDDDFGRERESGASNDLYRFRTASLLNVEVTAPYTHNGAYDSLDQVLRHYDDPVDEVDDFFDAGGWCQLEQFSALDNCTMLYPNARSNSISALDELRRQRNEGGAEFVPVNLNRQERGQIVAFLRSLTDPCVLDAECLSPWIANRTDAGPDGRQLNAIGL
jgi:cytochrome c peroxidase